MPEAWISDFLGCLDNSSGEKLDIEKAIMIKHAHLPKRVFKFRSFSDNSKNNLREGTLWVTSPSEYNDPYDCAASISVKDLMAATPPDEFDAIIAMSKVNEKLDPGVIQRAKGAPNPVMAIARALLEADKTVDPANIDGMLQFLDQAQEEVIGGHLRMTLEGIKDSVKICSFCTILNHITMWSHYGNEHKGFCMEFDVQALPQLMQRFLYPVIYSSEMFDATKYLTASIKGSGSFNNVYAQLQAVYKSPDWEYEKEWRLVIIGGVVKNPQNVNVGHPTKVHLGARMLDSHKSEIIEICKEKNIAVAQMKLSPERFELISEDISI